METQPTDFVGQVVEGDDSELVFREKQGAKLELGDLIVVDNERVKYICMVSKLTYGSLIEPDRILTSSGSMLEGVSPRIEFPDKDLRIFRRVHAMPLLEIVSSNGKPAARQLRGIPDFLSKARMASEHDFSFLETPKTKVFVGKIRSGSKTLPVDFSLDGEKLFSHHVLVSAQTGRGKSNFVKVLLWEAMRHGKFGIMVMDVHNEYYGTPASEGLKDHPDAAKALRYYSRHPPPGQLELKINLKSIDPEDLLGVVDFSEAQKETLEKLRRQEGSNWASALLSIDTEDKEFKDKKGTIRALKRKVCNIFNLRETRAGYECVDGVFDLGGMGEETVNDMAQALEDGKVVLLDGASISDDTGLVIASAVLRKVFERYDQYKSAGILGEKAQVGVVLEEAPRLIAGAYGDNIFSRIAREGRKFRIGLIAITQLASVIPREILANIGTKVIMGNEMALERKAIAESAAQDLEDFDRIIAGLEVGEAIVSSIFSKFAVPLKVPKFEDLVTKDNGGAESRVKNENAPMKRYF